MKKIICIMLSAVMMFAALSLCAFADDGAVEVLSAEWDGEKPVYKVVFSKPVHFFNSGYVWIRYAGPEDGDYQRNPSEIRYLGETVTKDGHKYSSEVEFVFPTASSKMDEKACGLCIVEYFLNDSNEGFVSPEIVCGTDGEMLKATYTNGEKLDFCWVPTAKRDTVNKYKVHISTPFDGEVQEQVGEVEIVSAEWNGEDAVYTLVFSGPVHIFKTGYVWLRGHNAEDGDGQKNLSAVKYLGEAAGKDGTQYSDTLELTFPAFDGDSYGISIVEYFLDDTNTGYVSPEIIRGENGEMLKGNYAGGGLDFCWIPVEHHGTAANYQVRIKENSTEIKLASARVIGEKTAVFVFGKNVKADDASKISASASNGTAVGKTMTANGKSVTVEFDKAIDGTTFSFAEGSISDKSGKNFTADGLKFSDYMLKGKEVNIQNKKLYSFMNCDTGRMLTCEEETEFRVFDEGNGNYSFRSRDGKKYLTFENGKLSFADEPFFFSLYLGNDYQRIQISVADGSRLSDDDGGDTADADVVLTDAGNDDISTGWYMTLYGDALPMRVAMVGDSITNGCTPDGELPKAGCRAKLSAELIEKYGKVVFVGSAVASHGADGSGGERSTVNDAFLYREEGHNGWVVTSQEGYAPANNFGIDTLIPNLMTKYKPDVVCMMLGINDIGQVGYNDVMRGNEKGEAYWGRWMKLANDILAGLPENGRFVVGTYTPQATGGNWNQAREIQLPAINEKLAEIVEGMHESDARISLTDNYKYVHDAGPDGVSTDGVHLNAKGYSAMADSYYDALIGVCDGITSREVEPDTYSDAHDGAKNTAKWLIPVIAAVAAVGAVVAVIFGKKKK